MNKKDKKHITPYASGKMKYIHSRKVVRKNVHATIPKIIWDMFNTLLLSNLLLLLSVGTGRHMSMASPAILSNFFEKE